MSSFNNINTTYFRMAGPTITWSSQIVHLCSPLMSVSLSGVCLSPCFSVLCELWVELVLFQIAPHSVHPPQVGPSSRSIPSHLHRCYLLCNVRVIVSPFPYSVSLQLFSCCSTFKLDYSRNTGIQDRQQIPLPMLGLFEYCWLNTCSIII